MICFCCGQEISSSSKKAGTQSKLKLYDRIEKILKKDTTTKDFWEKIVKSISLRDCAHSLKSIISSEDHITKGSYSI
jgi:hypothetical protein